MVIPNVFQTRVRVPLHSPNGRQMAAIWGCEKVMWKSPSVSYQQPMGAQ